MAYLEPIQSTLVQAQYWHDPIQKDLHMRESQFIAPINNELRADKDHNELYKENLEKLEKMGNLSLSIPRLRYIFSINLC